MSEKLFGLKKKGESGNSAKYESGITTISSSKKKFTLGFKPNKITVILYKDSTHFLYIVFDSDVSTSIQNVTIKNGSSSTVSQDAVPYSGTAFRIKSIDTDGFTMNSGANTSVFSSSLKWYAGE